MSGDDTQAPADIAVVRSAVAEELATLYGMLPTGPVRAARDKILARLDQLVQAAPADAYGIVARTLRGDGGLLPGPVTRGGNIRWDAFIALVHRNLVAAGLPPVSGKTLQRMVNRAFTNEPDLRVLREQRAALAASDSDE